jgi:hypothetical protein
MKTSRMLAIIAAVVAVLAVAVGGTIALRGNDSPVSPSDRGAVGRATAGDELAATVSALKGTPVALRGAAGYVELEREGADLTAARVAQRPAAGRTVYLVPSRGGACLTSEPLREGGCFDAATLSSTVTATSILCSQSLRTGAIEIYGTAPDGVDAVTVTREGGSRKRVPVRGNTYVFETDRDAPRPLTVTWTTNGKEGSISARVPADFRGDRCATPAAHHAKKTESGSRGPAERFADAVTKKLQARR